MSRAATYSARNKANQWLLIQIVATLTFALVIGHLKNPLYGQSVFWGGVSSILPQWVFARLWLARYNARATKQLVKTFYSAEIIKLTLTAALFIAIVSYLRVELLYCFIGFMIAQCAFWVACLFVGAQNNHETTFAEK